MSLAKGLSKSLKAVATAWIVVSLTCLTIEKVEISMEFHGHVHVQVQSEAGVGVRPRLV